MYDGNDDVWRLPQNITYASLILTKATAATN